MSEQESTPVHVSQLFEDMALLTMADWRATSSQELKSEFGVTFESLNPTATDLSVAAVSEHITAVRYTWTLASSVKLTDIHVFVESGDPSLPTIERHYRIRATEWI